MSVKVFIDGSSGTTGLRIADRLAARPDIELLSISAEGRKDVNERAKVINSADLAFLCLPDAASKEVMPLLRPDVRVLDTSTAFRTDTAWDYGFPELKGQKEKIKNSYRVAVPGCYASGFISIARPLVELGLAPADYPFSCTGISGYSGGGKKMIAEYENADRPAHSKLDAPKSYGLGLAHKHLPEMQKISGLAHTPAFVPVVCDYYSGMQVLVPLDLKLAGTSAEAVAAGIADYYKEGATVSASCSLQQSGGVVCQRFLKMGAKKAVNLFKIYCLSAAVMGGGIKLSAVFQMEFICNRFLSAFQFLFCNLP